MNKPSTRRSTVVLRPWLVLLVVLSTAVGAVSCAGTRIVTIDDYEYSTKLPPPEKAIPYKVIKPKVSIETKMDKETLGSWSEVGTIPLAKRIETNQNKLTWLGPSTPDPGGAELFVTSSFKAKESQSIGLRASR